MGHEQEGFALQFPAHDATVSGGNLFHLPDDLVHTAIRNEYPEQFGDIGKHVYQVPQRESGYRVHNGAEHIVIYYDRSDTSSYFRGLGQLMTYPQADSLSGVPVFPIRGVLVDNSRNAVHTAEYLQKFNVMLALLGFNKAMLYTENFEVDGHPKIQSDQLSKKEIASISEHGDLLGIEWSPVIEPYVHMEKVLKYPEYAPLRLNIDAINPEHPGTLPFVNTLIQNAAEPYKSKRIHLGCDEGLLSGQDSEIAGDYIEQLYTLAQENGLESIVFSDLFRQIPREQVDKIPRSMTPNFWYYGPDRKDFIRDRLQWLKELGFTNVIATAGAQTWPRAYPYYDRATANIDVVTMGASEAGISEVQLAAWMDNGGWTLLSTVTPLFTYFSERAWSTDFSLQNVKNLTKTITGDSWESFYEPSKMDTLLNRDLWDEPNLAIMLAAEDPMKRDISGIEPTFRFKAHFDELYHTTLDLADKAHSRNKPKFAFIASFFDFLRYKADLGNMAYIAYQNKNRMEMLQTAETIDLTIQKAEEWHMRHAEQWREERKEEGFALFSRRYQAMLKKLLQMQDVWNAYMQGKISDIPAFEEETYFTRPPSPWIFQEWEAFAAD